MKQLRALVPNVSPYGLNITPTMA